MTKLEFIDKYIELLKQKIESSKESARLYYANDDWGFGEIEEENRVGYEEELELFKQIKSDLQAWEVMKKHLILDKEFHRIDLHLYHDTKYKEDYLKLKKALEVK